MVAKWMASARANKQMKQSLAGLQHGSHHCLDMSCVAPPAVPVHLACQLLTPPLRRQPHLAPATHGHGSPPPHPHSPVYVPMLATASKNAALSCHSPALRHVMSSGSSRSLRSRRPKNSARGRAWPSSALLISAVVRTPVTSSRTRRSTRSRTTVSSTLNLWAVVAQGHSMSGPHGQIHSGAPTKMFWMPASIWG